jgi:hypothetical protein
MPPVQYNNALKKNLISCPQVAIAAHIKGDFFVDYEEKVFEDVKAQPMKKVSNVYTRVVDRSFHDALNMSIAELKHYPCKTISK